MGFLEAVDVYFRGEKHIGLALIPIGLALAGLGVYFWRWYGGGLGKGIGIPFAIVGALAAVGGGILYKTVADRQARLADAYEATPSEPVAQEQARIAKVNANWKILKISWAVLTVISLALLMFVKRDWVTGVALALLCLCAFLMVLDTFAEVRARIYADRISTIAAPP